MREFKINESIIVTQESAPFVIAEIGNNHNGSVNLCKSLMKRAKDNGADAVKLQKRDPKILYTSKLYNSGYVNKNSFGKTYGEHREALEFTHEQWHEIFNYAKSIDVLLFATPFDFDSAIFLRYFNPPMYKLASGTMRDIPLVKLVASFGKPIVASTGGGGWEDVQRLYQTLETSGVDFCLLHCIASYPNRAEDMNLNIIPEMMRRFPNTIIGLSDHYQSNLMANAAYCKGAMVFEKHFTSDHSLPGPDHALSLEPHELQGMVHDLQRIRAAMGTDEKKYFECEKKGIYKMGKGLYFNGSYNVGQQITYDMISIKSPEEGIPPHCLNEIVGMKVKFPTSKDQPITWGDIYV